MKQAAVALALLSGLASGSVFAAKVYSSEGTELNVGGRVEFRGDFIGTSKGAEIEGSMDDSTRARLNLKGQSQLNDTLTAFAVYEAEQDTGSDKFENRYMYAGVEFGQQALSFGRQDMASVIVADFTDITEFSGVQQVIGSSSDKQDSVFAYQLEVNALQVQATYQAEEVKDSDGYSIAGIYSAPIGLDLGLAFSGADLGDGAGSESQALVGVGFSLNSLYLGASYSQGDLDDKAVGTDDKEFTAMEFAAHYKLSKQMSAVVLYTYQENEQGDGAKYDKTDGVELAGYYKFSSNFRTYLSYYINNLDKETNPQGVHTQGEDTLRLGVRYDF